MSPNRIDADIRQQLLDIFYRAVISEEPYLSKGWSVNGIDSILALISQTVKQIIDTKYPDIRPVEEDPWTRGVEGLRSAQHKVAERLLGRDV